MDVFPIVHIDYNLDQGYQDHYETRLKDAAATITALNYCSSILIVTSYDDRAVHAARVIQDAINANEAIKTELIQDKIFGNSHVAHETFGESPRIALARFIGNRICKKLVVVTNPAIARYFNNGIDEDPGRVGGRFNMNTIKEMEEAKSRQLKGNSVFQDAFSTLFN